MLKYNKKLYVSKDAAVRKDLLKQHYNNILAKKFNTNKIRKLLSCKYY